MASLGQLTAYIDELLQVGVRSDVDSINNDPAGVYLAGSRAINKIGFALEPNIEFYEWAQTNDLDAVFVHRPFRLEAERLPAGLGIISYHRAFDTYLSVGYNEHLAADLGLRSVAEFARKDGLPLAMVGELEATHWTTFLDRVTREFEGVEAVVAPRDSTIGKVAVVGAMTDALVRKAAAENVDVYLSGQMRVPAREAIETTGIGVIATGHARAEHWGLRKLATLFADEFPDLRTTVAPLNI